MGLLCQTWMPKPRLLASWLCLCTLGCQGGPAADNDWLGVNAGVLERRAVVFEGQVLELPVMEVDGSLVFEGDILVDAAGDATHGAATSALIERTDGLWRGAIVPYVIDGGVPDSEGIRVVMDDIEAVTPVRFVARSGQQDYVAIVPDTERCTSFVGRIGGRQELTLRPNCTDNYARLHELLHALGFRHEHSRYDRDGYVRVNFDNVRDEGRMWLEILEPGFRQRGEYDLTSVMHYHSWAFSISPDDRSRPTMTTLDGEFILSAQELSPTDIASINQRYEDEVSSLCPAGEHDDDRDYLCSGYDNCPNLNSLDQTDDDDDGLGDLCDPCPNDPGNDPDADGQCALTDNCPDAANPDQLDTDGDRTGDVCDPCPDDPRNDIDGDGVCAPMDNCPNVANPDQQDQDGDGQGDTCDACPLDGDNNSDADGDGVCASVDNCPATRNPDQADRDGDGQGDACDVCPDDALNDADGDLICAPVDNCPMIANPEQLDPDGNGVGHACDAPVGGRIDGGGCSVKEYPAAETTPWSILAAGVVVARRRRRGHRRAYLFEYIERKLRVRSS